MTGAAAAPAFAALATRNSNQDLPNIIGPRAGFSPQIGTLVAMLTWMRGVVLSTAQGLTVQQLDYLHDEKANSIGALLLHLAATERNYQVHTFEGRKWGDVDEQFRKRWDVPARLGAAARKIIKGHDLAFYVAALNEAREQTLRELRKRDDTWLLQIDRAWEWGPTNNYCKWFHVCEHESNHNGQIKWIQRRLPGASEAAGRPARRAPCANRSRACDRTRHTT